MFSVVFLLLCSVFLGVLGVLAVQNRVLAVQMLAVLWVILFSVRGLLVPWMVQAGWLRATQVVEWDSGLLMRVYLVLLAVSVLVGALLLMRDSQSRRVVPPSVKKGKHS